MASHLVQGVSFRERMEWEEINLRVDVVILQMRVSHEGTESQANKCGWNGKQYVENE